MSQRQELETPLNKRPDNFFDKYRYCLADGRVVPATVLDHDQPREGDPDLFWRNTFTSLCKRHHDGEKQCIRPVSAL